MGDTPTSNEVLVERIHNVQMDVRDIKTNMATKTDQANTDSRIAALVGSLEAEKAERIAAVKEVKDRLQIVEDRMESRKYNTGIAIAISVIGAILAVVLRF